MKITRSQISTVLAALLLMSVSAAAWAQETRLQTESEFQELMPISGEVETFFGKFELDHSFPTKKTADDIYDLMDHQRASQLYLWSLPIVGTARIRLGLHEGLEGYEDNRFATIRRFNERRGFLTPNESTVYFLSTADTSKSAVVLDVPPGKIVGMVVDSWQESPADVGLFSEQRGTGGKHVFIGPNTPMDTIPEPKSSLDDFHIHHVKTNHIQILGRIIGTDEEVEQLSSQFRMRYYGDEPNMEHIDMQNRFLPTYQPRGLAYWQLLHGAINDEIVEQRDRFFLAWLKDLGIEKGKPFNPTQRQKKILIDGARQGELMARTLV
ncbi:MAG: DUF1254 domain-containing protein, partial [Desulfobacterales bacterium]